MTRRTAPIARHAALAATLLAAALLAPCAARAAGWRSTQPPPPPAPEGEGSVGVPVPLGHVGEISFWAPNRGLLITAGNEAVPAGLYYYNGVAWRELSTVCGGAEGRIAWAGPDDFWTISDQQAGQQIGEEEIASPRDRSLCHFVDGQVVASYAEPLGQPDSYQQMDAAACSGPDDCWFGGAILAPGANTGAFHLHWNGQTLSALPSLETPEPQLEDPARAVSDIIDYKGHFYESVQVGSSDQVPNESPTQPVRLHRIVEGSSKPFAPLIPALTYGEPGVKPWELSGFSFSGDEDVLWALAGPDGAPSLARPTALLLTGSEKEFHQVALHDPSDALESGAATIAGVAAEPGGEAAWVSIDPSTGPEAGPSALARVARISAGGDVEAATLLPEAGEVLTRQGPAGAIACPAPGDCWVATTEGWLFHRGGTEPPDEDPYFQSLITYRPPDASIPFLASDEAPPDTSGAYVAPQLPAANEALDAGSGTPPRAHEALFSKVKARLVKGTTLALTFTLATRSRVRLLALRQRRTVAATRRRVLARGRHTLELGLNRRAWPTKLDLQVKALGAVPLAAGGGGSATGGPTVVGTSLRAPAAAGIRTLLSPDVPFSPFS